MDISVLLLCESQQYFEMLKRGIVTSGFCNIQAARNQDDFNALLASGRIFDVAVIYVEEDYRERLENIAALRKSYPRLECVVVSAINDSDLAMECLRKGAYDYVTTPFTREDLASTIKKAMMYKVPVCGRPRILIMEDDPVSGRLMQAYLNPYGDCKLVVDGRAAIEAFEQAILAGDIYHLLVLDIMVPEIHGRDVLKRIREIESQHGVPASRRSRAIMTTALSDAGNVIESFKGHCDAYLIKPIDRKHLIREIAGLGFNMEIAAPR
jgi:two-component system, chemotaxis family, chemotaxis protein CheY